MAGQYAEVVRDRCTDDGKRERQVELPVIDAIGREHGHSHMEYPIGRYGFADGFVRAQQSDAAEIS